VKKKTEIIWLGIALATVIGLFEVFHPQVSVGRHKISWAGFRHIGRFGSSDAKIDGAKCELLWLGPITIVTSA
jgi:hypothetical protein